MAEMNRSHVLLYTDGNTVRKEAVALPEKQPFSEHKKKINRRLSTDEKVTDLSFLSVIGIIIAAIIAVGLCVDYIGLQTDIRVKMETINDMEEELAALISDNKVLKSEMTSYIDLDYVYEIATKELGMGYPTVSQIVYYESTDSEYVRQYGEISEVGSKSVK